MAEKTEKTVITRNSLVSGGTLLLLLIAVAAWSSNPDDASFRRYAAREAGRNTDGVFEHVAVRVLAKAALDVLDWERIDYGFFSVVVFPDYDLAFVGFLGTWHRIEPSEAEGT